MARNRKSYDAKTKFNVVIELIQGRKTQSQITSEYGVHPTQQVKRKEEFMKLGSTIFQDKRVKEYEDKNKKIEIMERKIGQFAIEVDWLQKKLTDSTSYSQRVELIDKTVKISQNRQAILTCISTSSLYYKSKLSELDLKIMSEIDLIYTEHMCYGARRISKELKKRGYHVGREKAGTYMEKMCICAMYPKKRTSIPNKDHKVYPYLLRGVKITRPNQVRSTDITYIKLPGGFVYLLAIIDRYSRKVIALDVSLSMDKEFCCGVLKKSLLLGKPEIFNSDQGSQFTSEDFIGLLENTEVKISMDGVGRCFDNIRIERLWRTVKYEDIHLNEYQTPIDTYHGLTIYFNKYNNSRLHSSLGYRTPSEAYEDKN